MKTLAERHADRERRKEEQQSEESRQREAETGFGRAGIGVTNRDMVEGGEASGNGGGTGWPDTGGGSGETDHFATVDSLTAHAGTLTDPAAIDSLIEAETAGKNRAGALSALEARKTALAAPQS